MTILASARAYFQAQDAQPATVQQIAERFGCSGRSAHRVLQILGYEGVCERRSGDGPALYWPVRIPVGEATELGTTRRVVMGRVAA